MAKLLSRDEFKRAVFARDQQRCIFWRFASGGCAPHYRAAFMVRRRLLFSEWRVGL